jgi:hypothetical protein
MPVNHAKLMGRLEDLNPDEQRLLRLFRCMVEAERHEFLLKAGLTLMKRLSVDPYSHKNENAPNEGADEDPDERIRGTWPGDWPGLKLLDLDCLGDPGFFISENFVNAAESLLGSSDDDEQFAAALTEAFFNWDFPDGDLPYLFEYEQNDGTVDELRTTLQQDFFTFIREWRERIVKTFEHQVTNDDVRHAR